MEERIKNFCNDYGLGGVLALHPVSGGLLHKMYRVETSSGIYAVKVLNPEKNIGLYLNDSLSMSPSKSVTAFAGLKPI